MQIEIAAHMQNMTRRDKGLSCKFFQGLKLAQEIFNLKVTRTHYNLLRQHALKWLAFHIFPIPFKNTQKVSVFLVSVSKTLLCNYYVVKKYSRLPRVYYNDGFCLKYKYTCI